MFKVRKIAVALVRGAVVGAGGSESPLAAGDSQPLRAMFADPPRQFATAPLWVWNDLLAEEQIRSSLRDLAGQGVKQAFVHPRPGLMTPYLSDQWFHLWNVALEEAERLDMNIWIYDENSYPSGFAGGLVPEAMPESRGKGLHFQQQSRLENLGDDVLVVYRLQGDSYENVTKQATSGQAMPEGRYLVGRIRLAPEGGWFGGKYYVDLIRPGVTEKFLEITLEAYRRHIGRHFGERVPGAFTDEPHLAPAGGLHWSDHLPELFRKRWGYDLMDHLPALVRPIGPWKRVRHNYYCLLLEQFIERWAKPYYEYCEKHDLEFTGHYWEHGWPGAGHGGDNMAMYAWHQRPAIDILMNRYSEDVHAQFGNVRSVIELASVANQLDRRRTLCEAFGAGGWDLRFEDMKRIADWLFVLGVNTLDEHLSFITIRGERKHDHPQSFSYHEPWWDSYHVLARYFARLSLATSQGRQVNRILLLEPTTTAWMYQGDSHLEQLGQSFQQLVTTLAKRQVEFDLGSEDIIGRFGSTTGKQFQVGSRRYDVVVLPPGTENLNSPTVKLLKQYLDAGGRVLCCGPAPERVDGSPSDQVAELAEKPTWEQVSTDQLAELLLARWPSPVLIRQDDPEKGVLFHHRRELDDGQLLLLVNTSIETGCSGTLRAKAAGIERWDAMSGKIRPFPFRSAGMRVEARFHLPPCGSLLLFLSRHPVKPAARKPVEKRTLTPAGAMEIERIGPNVLTLDYVDLLVGDQRRENVYFYLAERLIFQQHGLEGNPWDRAVQLRDSLLKLSFPPDSGFSASYRFTIAEEVPRPLWIVIERPDLYAITCNGKQVQPSAGRWWLDRSFGMIDITAAAKVGENIVTITARPMTIFHELQPAYVLGDFALRPTGSGFVITRPVQLRIERQFGHDNPPEHIHWLSAGIGYHRDPEGAGNDPDPAVVFDLGKECKLERIEIWNYNEVNLTARGAKQVAIRGSATGQPGSFTVSLGTFELAEADGSPTAKSQQLTIPATAGKVRYVELDILSNQRGTRYPAEKTAPDNAFVGLSEVRFWEVGAGGKPQPVEGVKIHRVTSELAGNHDRLAVHLVDGSGLAERGVGWDEQGHPFYAQGVVYRQKFQVDRPSGRYVVELSDWLGSVAKVRVNGKLSGHIFCRPWRCDVSEQITAGENTVEVLVVGTLKNTLGPHHAGPLRGAAWPHMFQRAPETGPPPGRKYDTIGYGLFGPIRLVNLAPK